MRAARRRLLLVRPSGADERGRADRNADGIVVLTGGAFRITDALELLAAGRGKRLLISGVNPAPRVQRNRAPRCRSISAGSPAASISTIRRHQHHRQRRSRRGAGSSDRGFQSLIVVTSDYHMPRAMAELAHQLPDVALVPFPVVSEKVRVETWWDEPDDRAAAVLGVCEVYRRRGPHAGFRLSFD